MDEKINKKERERKKQIVTFGTTVELLEPMTLCAT